MGSSRVSFTIITSNISSISVAASMAYSDAVRLNETSIQCDTEGTIIINVSDVMTSECLWVTLDLLSIKSHKFYHYIFI